MPKSDFNKVALQLYWNHTSAWVSPVNLLYIFRTRFPKNTSGQLLLIYRDSFKQVFLFLFKQVFLFSISVVDFEQVKVSLDEVIIIFCYKVISKGCETAHFS